MKLAKDLTSITAEEQVIHSASLMDGGEEHTCEWRAYLDGESADGESVRMDRGGKTPDDALRILFEAMHAARVTL